LCVFIGIGRIVDYHCLNVLIIVKRCSVQLLPVATGRFTVY